MRPSRSSSKEANFTGSEKRGDNHEEGGGGAAGGGGGVGVPRRFLLTLLLDMPVGWGGWVGGWVGGWGGAW